MIAHLNGKIERILKDQIVIDVLGVGYLVNMPSTDISKLKLYNDIRIYTYTDIKEGYIALFGFLSEESLSIFEKLKKVNGVGSKTAQNIISTITPQDLCIAIASEDYGLLSKIPGIGTKTAARIILELKDKILKEIDSAVIKIDKSKKTINNNESEAILALKVLGYSTFQIEEALCQIKTQELNVQEIIKETLKQISKK